MADQIKKESKIKKFFKDYKSEFKKITWASKRTTFKNFGLVLASVLAIALVLGLVDAGLNFVFGWLGTLI